MYCNLKNSGQAKERKNKNETKNANIIKGGIVKKILNLAFHWKERKKI